MRQLIYYVKLLFMPTYGGGTEINIMNNFSQSYQQPAQAPYPTYTAPIPAVPQKKSGNKLLTVFVIITFLMAAASTVFTALLYFSGEPALSAEAQLEETKAYNAYGSQVADNCIEVGDFEIVETYEDSVHFTCELENVSSKNLEEIYVYYKFYNKDGDLAGSTYSYLPALDADSSITVSEYSYFPDIKKVEVSDIFAVYSSDIH